MQRVATHQRLTLLLFAGFATCVYAVSLMLSRRLPGLEEAAALAIGMTIDMVVLVPLAFYFLVVRRRRLSIVTLAPVIILSLVAASRVLPAAHQQPLHLAEIAVVPLELGLIGWIAWRAIRAVRRARVNATADRLEQFHAAAFELTRNERAAGMIASEMAVFYYALGSWRARPHVPAGMAAFSQHRESGQAGIVFAFLLLMAGEGFAVHVLLLRWGAIAAWIFTASTIYAALWLIADYRATVLRPILVGEESIRFRCGLRWTVEVPLSRIAGLGREKPAAAKRHLGFTLLGAPTCWITFSPPAPARGAYGSRRHARGIGFHPDEPERFERELHARADRLTAMDPRPRDQRENRNSP